MFLSATKWIIVSIFASIAFYKASPKYFFTEKGHVRCNRITGEVQEIMGKDPYTGTRIFGKKPPEKSTPKKSAKVDISKFFEDIEDEFPDDRAELENDHHSCAGRYFD